MVSPFLGPNSRKNITWPTNFSFYEYAAAVNGSMTPSLSVQSSSVTTTHSVDPDTSIHRQGDMSIFFHKELHTSVPEARQAWS